MEKAEDYFIETKKTFSDKIQSKSADEIAIEYSNMNLVEHLTFVAEICNKLGITLKGEGMEVAAGTATFACTIGRLFPSTTKIYALDIAPDVVNKLQPKTIAATSMQDRVIPVVGDFNNIQLPDASLDFVLGFNSFHHSNDLKKTLSEVSRILKPGGKVVFFDRCHPNHMPKAQEHFLLHQEYSREYKIQHGLDPEGSYTRTEEGEHELRIKDWHTAFANTGLTLDSITIFTQRTWWRFLKILASAIPFFIRCRFNIVKNLTLHYKMLLYYVFPPFGRLGKLKIFSLHTKLTTRPMIVSMGHHTIFVAHKKAPLQ